MNFFRSRADTYQEFRRFAVLLLTDRAHQALHAGPRMSGDPAQAEGGQLIGWPPAPAGHTVPDSTPATDLGPADPGDRRNALHTLASLLLKVASYSATPADVREIAELWEYLDRDDEALPWWVKAAEMGDEDAQGYLEILLEGRQQNREDEMVSPRAVNQGCWVDLCAPPNVIVQVDLVCALPDSPGRRPLSPQVVDIRSASVEAAVERMVREIETFRAHPDQMTDGRTR